ncbi:hypothetical protein KKH13_05035 [Patescibacteria group bacterium]|nr:hypothetical protein [Patescibacteria group bacterium]
METVEERAKNVFEDWGLVAEEHEDEFADLIKALRLEREKALDEAVSTARTWHEYSITDCPKGHEIFAYRKDIAKEISKLKAR